MITITIITIKIIITRAINMLKIKLITSLTSFASNLKPSQINLRKKNSSLWANKFIGGQIQFYFGILRNQEKVRGRKIKRRTKKAVTKREKEKREGVASNKRKENEKGSMEIVKNSKDFTLKNRQCRKT